MILRAVLGSAFLNCGPIALHSEQGWSSPHPSSSIDQSRCCPGLEGGTYASWWPDPVHSHVPQLEEKCFDFLSQPRSFLAWSLTDFFNSLETYFLLRGRRHILKDFADEPKPMVPGTSYYFIHQGTGFRGREWMNVLKWENQAEIKIISLALTVSKEDKRHTEDRELSGS